MRKGKSPNLDGFTTKFYQSCRPTLREEIWVLVENSKRITSIHCGFYVAFLDLSQKDKKTESLASFRPIVPCNIIYTIVSKVIPHKLKAILPKIISNE